MSWRGPHSWLAEDRILQHGGPRSKQVIWALRAVLDQSARAKRHDFSPWSSAQEAFLAVSKQDKVPEPSKANRASAQSTEQVSRAATGKTELSSRIRQGNKARLTRFVGTPTEISNPFTGVEPSARLLTGSSVIWVASWHRLKCAMKSASILPYRLALSWRARILAFAELPQSATIDPQFGRCQFQYERLPRV